MRVFPHPGPLPQAGEGAPSTRGPAPASHPFQSPNGRPTCVCWPLVTLRTSWEAQMTLSFDAFAAKAPKISHAPEIRISEESPFDVAAREALLDRAFGPGRDARTSARLRDGRLPARGLALVA